MIIYKPTGKTFSNRKEAKIYFGTGLFNRLMKHTEDFEIINTPTSAIYEVHNNSEKVPETNRRN